MHLLVRGFTLIELMVVLLLVMILIGVVELHVGGNDSAEVRQEAERLALLMNTAQQEAILQGEVLALAVASDGYQFLRLNSAGTLEPLTGDDTLRARQLPPGIRVDTVSIDGQLQEATPHIILWPSGELTQFTITLRKGQVHSQVVGSQADGIRSGEVDKSGARAQG
jgi:general secretion pathway protein H